MIASFFRFLYVMVACCFRLGSYKYYQVIVPCALLAVAFA
jgi:hypothetical protein